MKIFVLFLVVGLCAAENVVFDLPVGKVRGDKAGNYSLFRGITYASASSRFQPSQIVEKLYVGKDKIFNATQFGAICPQNNLIRRGEEMSEDCLHLNIWTPWVAQEKKTKFPVMVYIHGGAFIQGSGNDIYIDGAEYAKKGIILVTLNYRLGLFGFFSHPELTKLSPNTPTNFGLLDQICALKWIKKYIPFFGGNIDDLTVFGESAGGASVQWLLSSQEHAKQPLFTRAILQSPPCAAYAQDLAEAEGQGEDFAKAAGCQAGTVVECLRNLTFTEMVDLTWSRRTYALPVSALPYSPTRMATPHVDYVNFLEHPYKHGISGGTASSHNIIIGTTLHEWMLFLWLNHIFMMPPDEWMHDSVDLVFSAPFFSQRNRTTTKKGVQIVERIEQLYPRAQYKSGVERVSAIYTDLVFFCPSKGYAKRLVEQGANVHFYIFTHEAAHGNTALRAFHSAELPFVFQKAVPSFLGGLVKLYPSEFTPEEVTLSNSILGAWTTLKEKGGNFFGTKEWPTFNKKGENFLEISVAPKITREFQEEQCEFWNEILPGPHETIQFDLMAHEPFLLKLANGYTLTLARSLHLYGKPIIGALVLALVMFTYKCCVKTKSKQRKSHKKSE